MPLPSKDCLLAISDLRDAAGFTGVMLVHWIDGVPKAVDANLTRIATLNVRTSRMDLTQLAKGA